MCRARTCFTSRKDWGEDFDSSLPCPDPNHLDDVCYYHLCMKHGLIEPNFPEYAKDAKVFIGDVQIWPVA